MTYLSNSDDSQFQNPQAPAIDPSTVQQPAAPTPRPSVWGNVLKGALQGLALHGIPGAVAGAVDPEEAHRQIAQHRAMAQAKVEQAQNLPKFQSAQAANLASEAVARQRQADNADSETRIKLDESNRLNSQLLIQSNGNPTMVVPYDPNDHEDKAAHAAMNTLAQQNGGVVPPVLTSHVGNNILLWNMNDVAKNDASSLGQVNDFLRINNRPEITPGDWSNKTKYPDAAKTQMIENAAKFYQVPTSKDPVELGVEAERLKQAIASAPKNTDPAKLSLLKHNLDTTQHLANTATSITEGIKRSEQYAAAAAQKQARLDVDQSTYQNQLAAGDVTGWKPEPGKIMSEQQFNAANTKFVSGALAKAQDTEKSYQMFQDAYANKDNDKTGAASMLALSQHLATTFGSVKGARVTKDMIQEHLGARNISDSALVAVQKLTNGDKLSPDQWKDFRTLISDARAQTWKNTVKQAHSLGIPVTADMLPSQKGQ